MTEAAAWLSARIVELVYQRRRLFWVIKVVNPGPASMRPSALLSQLSVNRKS